MPSLLLPDVGAFPLVPRSTTMSERAIAVLRSLGRTLPAERQLQPLPIFVMRSGGEAE